MVPFFSLLGDVFARPYFASPLLGLRILSDALVHRAVFTYSNRAYSKVLIGKPVGPGRHNNFIGLILACLLYTTEDADE